MMRYEIVAAEPDGRSEVVAVVESNDPPHVRAVKEEARWEEFQPRVRLIGGAYIGVYDPKRPNFSVCFIRGAGISEVGQDYKVTWHGSSVQGALAWALHIWRRVS